MVLYNEMNPPVVRDHTTTNPDETADADQADVREQPEEASPTTKLFWTAHRRTRLRLVKNTTNQQPTPQDVPADVEPVQETAPSTGPSTASPPPVGIPAEWDVTDGVLTHRASKPPMVLGPVLWIVAVVAREDGEQELKVRWNGGSAVLDARAMSDPYRLTDLASRGFPVIEDRRKPFSRWLHDLYILNKDILPVEHRTGRLGWHGSAFVWPNEVVTSPSDAAPRIAFRPRNAEAARIATAIRTRRGSLDGWIAAVRPAYETFPHVAATVCVGFGSLLLDEPLQITEGLIGDISERSQVGKTSELRIVASAFGEASGEDRLVTTWGSTPAGLEHRAGTLGSLPVLLDESRERRRNAQVAPYVYMLANGHGPDRGTPNGAAERVSWRLATLSTGEASLIKYVEQAGGAVGRILPLPGMPFGDKSSERAKMVAHVVHAADANCGWAARAFVRSLLAGDFGPFDALRADYTGRVESLLGRGYESRLASHVALVELTAALLERAFGLRAPNFTALWFQARNASGKPGDERAALDALISIVAENRNRIYGLPDDDDSNHRWGEELGVYRDGKLALHPDRTKRELEQRGFDYQTAVTAWKRDGLLETDGRHIGPKVQCGTMRHRMLRFTAAATVREFGIGAEDDTDDDETRP